MSGHVIVAIHMSARTASRYGKFMYLFSSGVCGTSAFERGLTPPKTLVSSLSSRRRTSPPSTSEVLQAQWRTFIAAWAWARMSATCTNTTISTLPSSNLRNTRRSASDCSNLKAQNMLNKHLPACTSPYILFNNPMPPETPGILR